MSDKPQNRGTFYLTTPLYYPNARPHVGSAYTTIVCDVLARYKRMGGYDVAFLTGTDEHGEKLARAAEAAGKSPGEFVAEQRKLFVELWRKLGLVYDYFVYTDQPDHVTSVQRMLLLAEKNEPGVVEKRRYEGRYCIFDERYVSDSTDPVNCDICGRPAELISEDNYFFKLSAFEDRLLKLYRRHLDDPTEYPTPFVQPDFRLNEVTSLVKGGLRDISISRRRIKWGVPWPGDPEQVFYVWYDALIGYMTGIGYADGERGNATFQKYWRNTEGIEGSQKSGARSQNAQPGAPSAGSQVASPGEFMHMIGKDILRQHAVYWPAFLMAAGMPLPKTVFAHGYINYEQDKMSKSKGNVVYPEPIVDALDSFGAPGNDALRYYLLREAPFGQDMSFSYDALIQRYNSDLANDLGNLANRTINMLSRYFGGVVPRPLRGWEHLATPYSDADGEQVTETAGLPPEWDPIFQPTERIAIEAERLRISLTTRFEGYDPSQALANAWGFVGDVNKYLVQLEPWVLAESNFNSNQSKVATILCTAGEALRFIAVLLAPVVPRSAQQIWRQLGCEGKVKNRRIDQLKWGGLKPGTKVGKPEPIFPRLDKAKTLARLRELAEADRERHQPKGATIVVPEQEPSAVSNQHSALGNQQSPAGEQSPITNHQSLNPKITIDDFTKVDMVVGQIVSAEAIPGAKKLLKLQVDIGSETRQVCAGIAEYYKPEELTGMKIVLVANLEPRKLRGVESNGMVVAASAGPEGKPVLATFKEDVPNGTRLK
ncbi:MAG TPA: methionine--tRNA ligase [Terriglobia bacterium]|nr:methionine--tRNA ligase [Terriglobia bacterium]